MGNLICTGDDYPIDSAKDEFTYNNLIDGIKNKKYKNIVFLSGAGISVASGIPDFRSPGTGLYAKVQELKLPYPEALFTLDYFKKNPKKFYEFASAFVDTLDAKPVLAHHFVNLVNKHNQLKKSFTQNVDGLELEAGLPSGRLIEAHGHLREAKCISCGKKKDPEKLKEYLRKAEVWYCTCGGLVKPTIVFFGESLPISFYTSLFHIKFCDLAIVMGTSLTVFPFANLINMVPKKVPMVLINRDEAISDRKKFLFMGGDLETNMAKLIKDLDWQGGLPQNLQEKVTQLTENNNNADIQV